MNDVLAPKEVKAGELVEKNINDLLEMLDKIKDSLKMTDNLMMAAEEMEERGRWKGFFSSLSGKSDKELAQIVKGLGANIKVTQEVVSFLIELAQHKNTVQEGFLDALNEKITEQQNKLQCLDENDNSLDENAKQVETAVLTLYQQVHTQVESEVLLRRNVDKNMKNIGALYEALDSKTHTDEEQSQQISQLIQAMREKTLKLEELRLSLKSKEEHLSEVAQGVEEQSKKLLILEHGLEIKALKLEQIMNDIEANTSADKLREKRIIQLERGLDSLAGRKIPQTPAYISIGLSIIALGSSIYLSNIL